MTPGGVRVGCWGAEGGVLVPTRVDLTSDLKLIAFAFARATPRSGEEDVALGLLRAKLAQRFGVEGRMFRLPFAGARAPERIELEELSDGELAEHFRGALLQLRDVVERGCAPAQPGDEAHEWRAELQRAGSELQRRLERAAGQRRPAARSWSASSR